MPLRAKDLLGIENLSVDEIQLILETAESFDNGMSGKIQLNKAGDRIGENYDFWTVSKHPEKGYYLWKTENVPVETNH